MSKFQDIAREVLELRMREREIKFKILEFTRNYDLIANIAMEHPNCVTVNWQKLAYPRERRS